MGEYVIAPRTLVLTMKSLGMNTRQISDIITIWRILKKAGAKRNKTDKQTWLSSSYARRTT
jgi:hypothetical protein